MTQQISYRPAFTLYQGCFNNKRLFSDWEENDEPVWKHKKTKKKRDQKDGDDEEEEGDGEGRRMRRRRKKRKSEVRYFGR